MSEGTESPMTPQMKVNYYVVPWLLFGVDLLVILASVYLAIYVTRCFDPAVVISPTWRILLPIMHVTAILMQDLYRGRRLFYDIARKLFKATCYTMVAGIIFDFTLHTGGVLTSRLFVGSYWVLSLLGLLAGRYVVRRVLRRLGVWQNRVIIIGAGKTAEQFIHAFYGNYYIVGFIEDRKDKPLLKQYPWLGGFDDIERVLQENPVHEVIIAAPGLPRDRLVGIFYRVQPYVRKTSLIPDLFGIPIANVKTERSLDDHLLVLKTTNSLQRRTNRCLKRAFDLVAGSIIAVCIAPILVATAIAIKLDSPGPVFYNAERIGKNLRRRGMPTFTCYKFRSMYVNADEILRDYLAAHPEAAAEWREFQKLRGDDPRVTRVGRFIRKYSIDELPQIFNVLRGNMSLVGPRPYLPREREKIGDYYHVICMTTPGITGLWQVSGRNDIAFDGRLQLDAWYVRNWSLWQDITLLVRTIGVVLGQKGAY
ncbi:MAG: undecaprenyl-phosphate galactose phosphotransferase WbaP [Selenomonadaceae bacterium]|nr:undecaprenyl-phosphate galactose phosphotransferase WbaP [Selenomonadaceae bacterium]MDD7056689.1 undecaprenyl-phosphate galactose phosphotransferase WbaP [Selenomonadaceae bacterium]MDY3915644.1 undecaprenyl-phosphate galactose phosphotransferase WbaP [Selenomonadaceae bacterium]